MLPVCALVDAACDAANEVSTFFFPFVLLSVAALVACLPISISFLSALRRDSDCDAAVDDDEEVDDVMTTLGRRCGEDGDHEYTDSADVDADDDDDDNVSRWYDADEEP